MKIYLDAGHGGSDPGAVANGLEEKYLNFTVAEMVASMLKSDGHEVLMNRDGDTGTDADTNIINSNRKCNEWGADYAYSIHHNAGGGYGYDLVYSDFIPRTLSMVNFIAEEFSSLGRKKHNIFTKTYTDQYGQIKDWYGIMRDMDCPSVIIEYCFLDTTDYLAVASMKGLTEEAEAIFRGIKKFTKPVFNDPPAETFSQMAERFKKYMNEMVDKFDY